MIENFEREQVAAAYLTNLRQRTHTAMPVYIHVWITTHAYSPTASHFHTEAPYIKRATPAATEVVSTDKVKKAPAEELPAE